MLPRFGSRCFWEHGGLWLDFLSRPFPSFAGAPTTAMTDRATRLLLLASVFTIATCGLIYELIASTLASYLQIGRAHV